MHATPTIGADALGHAAPESGEGPTGANGRPLRDFGNKQRHSAADALAAQRAGGIDGDRKAVATLRARLALQGFALTELADGWLVHRWNCSRACADLRGVAAFADQVEGAR